MSAYKQQEDFVFRKSFHIESLKTTSMETVSTGLLDKIKNILLEVNIKPKNDVMYQEIYNCICQNTKKLRNTIHYVKPTAQLLFKSRFPKGGPTCRKQVFNPRHQTPQGQSVAKPETELLDENKGHQDGTHHPTHRFRRLFLDLLSKGWRGSASVVS